MMLGMQRACRRWPVVGRARFLAGTRRQAGVTLIELLASVLIFSLCIALMSNAFFQVGRLLTVVERGRDLGGAGLRLSGSLQAAVANLVMNPLLPTDKAPVFEGDALRFTGLTTRHPLGQAGQVQALVVTLDKGRLRIAPATGGATTGSAAGAELVLGDADQALRWVYLDHAGQLQGQWPVRELEQEYLPSAVFLVAKSAGLSDAWPQPLQALAGQAVLASWAYGGSVGEDMSNPGNTFGAARGSR